MAIRFLIESDLPKEASSREFVGEQYGGVGACVIFFDGAPGAGPRLHKHPYVEILIVVEGTATFNDGQSTRVVHAGEMAVVDPGQAHAFVNSGEGRLRQIDIHLSARFATEWLA
jgi:quercetin dioxygenase-like cupin family protein